MPNDPQPTRRLDGSEFASALQKGQGRALLHVMAYGLDAVADLVLDACLHDQRYDSQVESSRAPWLFQMFSKSGQYLRFRDLILEHLKAETVTSDFVQLLELAKDI